MAQNFSSMVQDPPNTWDIMARQQQALEDNPDPSALMSLANMVDEPPPAMSVQPPTQFSVPQPWAGMPAKSGSVSIKTKIPGKNPQEDAARQQMLELVKQYGQASQDALAQQQQGVGQLEDQVNKAQNAPTNFLTAVDWKPLASIYGMNPASMPNYESPEAKQQRLATLQNELQKARQGLSKEKTDALKDQIGAYKATKDTSLDDMLKIAHINYYGGGVQNDRQNERLGEQAYREILQNIEKNPTLKIKMQQIQGLDNAGAMIEKAPEVTPQLFHDYQQAVVSAVNRGNSGVGERAERYFTSRKISAANIKQFLTGRPMDLGKDDPMVQAIKDFAKIERTNIEKQYNNIVKASAAGQDRWLTPERRKDLDTKIRAMGATVEEPTQDEGLAVGTIVKGADGDYKFKGGDRTKKENWEKIK